MNGESVQKSRILDTHYHHRVRRWSARHGERDRKKESERERVRWRGGVRSRKRQT